MVKALRYWHTLVLKPSCLPRIGSVAGFASLCAFSVLESSMAAAVLESIASDIDILSFLSEFCEYPLPIG